MRLLLLLLFPLSLSADVREVATSIVRGWTLDSAAADSLERSVASKPDDFKSRTTLIGYYFRLESLAGGDENALRARVRHLAWIAEHRPESEIWGLQPTVLGGPAAPAYRDAYESLKPIWLRHIQAKDATEEILVNAARFLAIADRSVARQAMEAWLQRHPKSKEARYILGAVEGMSALGLTRTLPIGIPEFDGETDLQSPASQEAYREALAASDSRQVCGAAGAMTVYGSPLASGKWSRDLVAMVSNLIKRGHSLEPGNEVCRESAMRIIAWEEMRRSGWLGSSAAGPDPIVVSTLFSGLLLNAGGEVGHFTWKQPGEGEVLLTAIIGTDGKFEKLEPVMGPPELRPSAVQYVEKWRFAPLIRNGTPVRYAIAVTLKYLRSGTVVAR